MMDAFIKFIESINKHLPSIAIIFGAIWTYFLFIHHRQWYPRADIKHHVIQKPLENGKVLFHVAIEVDNLGDILIKLELGEVRLLQVLPLVGDIKDNVQNGKDPITDNEREIKWYKLFSRILASIDNTCEIEPREKETFHCDFVVNNDVKTVMAYSFFHNKKKLFKNLGWTCEIIHDIEGGNTKKKKWLNLIIRL
jgi:hypothetical protein